MPEKLRVFLESLSPEDAKAIYEYIDQFASDGEIDEILYQRSKNALDIDDESIFDDRDSTSIHN